EPVEISRFVTEADLTVYVNASTTRGFSGGWKSICVGLSTYRSIHTHHSPDTMSMSTEKNRMHESLERMGRVVDDRLGPGRVFKVETLLSNPLQVHRVLGRLGGRHPPRGPKGDPGPSAGPARPPAGARGRRRVRRPRL